MKRILFSLLAAFIAFCSVSCASRKPDSFTRNPVTAVINAPAGNFQGVSLTDRPVELFAGIPFAQPPVGDLRWKEPQPLDYISDVYKADHFQALAPQGTNGHLYQWLFNRIAYHGKGDRTDFAPRSEDCLYLNIWRPEGTEPDANLPVCVFIHGGSLMGGSSWYEPYDGTTYAENGVIMVTVAYRVGVFGYFALPELADESPNGTTGNYGLLDQIAALQWVHDNISSFGGNPANVTIAGESAGSSSVNAVCASPLASGLFERAIAESSGLVVPVPPHTFRTMEAAVEMGRAIQDEMDAHSLEELRALPMETLLKTKYRNSGMTVDGYALPATPYEIYQAGKNNEKALLNGFNKEEAFFFTLMNTPSAKEYPQQIADIFGEEEGAKVLERYPATSKKTAKRNFNDIITAFWFSYQHHTWTRTLASQGKPVWEYYFSKDNSSAGANHAGELPYLYGNLPKGFGYKKDDFALQDTMVQYAINFVKYGDPNGPGLPLWQSANEAPGQVLELGNDITMREDPFADLYPSLDARQELLRK